MLCTALAVVTRELTVPEENPAIYPPADRQGVSAALAAYGLTSSMRSRTVVFIVSGDCPLPTGSGIEGIAVHMAESMVGALMLAHAALTDGTKDVALVLAGPSEPGTVRASRVTLRRMPSQDRTAPASGSLHGPLYDAARMLLWSGRHASDEAQTRAQLRSVVDRMTDHVFRALPAVVPCGQDAGPVRAAALCSREDPTAALDAARAVTVGNPRPVALLFPGQGSQHTAMACGLYTHEPVFTEAVDTVLDLMGDEGAAVRADWLAPRERAIGIDDVRRAQPLLFAVDYALGKVIMSWGVRPTALLGHSAGELVAATFAGVMSLEDAVMMMRERVRHALSVPAGGMLAVAASEAQLRPYLVGEVAIAAVNTGLQTMLAGPAEQLLSVRKRLQADGHTVMPVPATSPFHSPAMAPAADAIEREYARIGFRPPRLALYSGYTGELMSERDALSPRFWARQITDTVYFRPALDQLLAAQDMLLVEAGPLQTLTAFARRHPAVRSGASAVVPMLPARPQGQAADRRSLLGAVARLWTEGHDLNAASLSQLWADGESHAARRSPVAPGRS
ncbi:acyltransferase domain-containing protein [Streptomyces sp. NBC_00654]|uniref:acyltransferase domain-containing protein n=1 Tax=Streptomyces sp. NBC_00654 TaxID=2975799 RepID=UPI0022532AAD|nr:acyltransferase domain-containing protein [Streptomyces sp. NBC_00654]MCX4970546.1 acyltransferase domain-containing protein [Streptomyces sp. NBC_00654]